MKQKIITTMVLLISLMLILSSSNVFSLQSNTANAAPTSTMGYTTIGSHTDRTPVGDKDSCRYKALQSGMLSSISMYFQTANVAVRFGVYSDLNGKPNQLLGQSSLVTTTGNSWTTAPVSVPVVAGQRYWLTIVSNSMVYWNYDFGALAGNGREPTTTLSSSYGTFTSWGTAKFSMYATISTSQTPSSTAIPTRTPAPTNTPTPIPTATPTQTPRPTNTPTPIPTATPTQTPRPTNTPTPIPTATPTQTPTPTGQPVWSTNAEISSLSQLGMKYWIEKDGGSDSVQLTTSVVHSGTKSLELTCTSKRVELDLYPGSLIQNDFYVSFYVYVPSSFQVSSYFTLFQLEGSILPNYEPIWAYMINPPNNNHIVLYGRDNDGQQLGNGGVQADSGKLLPRDQWVHIEYYTHIGTSGNIKAWMNGAQMWNVNCDTSGLKLTAMYFSPMIYGSSGTIYIDDIDLYNTNIRG